MITKPAEKTFRFCEFSLFEVIGGFEIGFGVTGFSEGICSDVFGAAPLFIVFSLFLLERKGLNACRKLRMPLRDSKPNSAAAGCSF